MAKITRVTGFMSPLKYPSNAELKAMTPMTDVTTTVMISTIGGSGKSLAVTAKPVGSIISIVGL